ncbi:hypothetical protein CEUSTIGMA_g14085.t1 [Chlamydomonas eustigma]|uniref:Uncharacterized protein n=1 Tax=Chlamydomonas eustigma TaxID=1157962 RepID=A0A250XUD9_9CHLO|nr:hypothetical protein CEUSTIGMA_g14085.t1 [Chlamydomonas eustigma]|eukprot:GAX86677.1 hypothetical protein CEUSTIGMA_g14085.t1 [Chlamydomonas eustigma]
MTQKKGDWLKTAIIGAAVCFAAREFMKGMVVLAEGNVGAARELKIGMVAIEEGMEAIAQSHVGAARELRQGITSLGDSIERCSPVASLVTFKHHPIVGRLFASSPMHINCSTSMTL